MTLRDAAAQLSAAGCEDALYCARELFRHYEKLSDTQLYGANPTSENDDLIRAVKRRAEGEPLCYILGYADFYRERYVVTPDVLIPRPETELLVDYAVEHLKDGERFADLCTGSGCIALSVLSHTKNTRATLVDISEGALRVAAENAERLGLSERTDIVRADVLHDTLADTFDMILSNPPYVDDAVYPHLSREIHREPRIAFVGGRDGMDFYRAIIEQHKDRLHKDGKIVLEIGYDQGERITALGESAGFSVEIKKDHGGLDRVAILLKKPL